MLLNFRRICRCQWLQLMTTCLVLSVMVMVCWDNGVVGRVSSYSDAFVVRSFTVTRENARSFRDFRYLLDHPGKCAGQDVLLLLFVKSSPGNAERRAAIRSTWGNETYISLVLGVTVKLVFALGSPPPERTTEGGLVMDTQEALAVEDRLHGDLIQQDFRDSFHNLTLKLLLQIHWARHRCGHAHFLMSADDDIFVHMPNLVAYLRGVAARGQAAGFWIGHVHRGAPPIRRRDSKYCVSADMYPWTTYPDYTAGSGYVVSRDVADSVYRASLTLNASLYIDDVFMGICGSAAGISPREHVFFSGEGKTLHHPCIYDQMMTSHGHVDDIHDLWQKATAPEVKRWTSGFMGRLYCTAVKVSLLCKPYYINTYPCKAAFYTAT